MKDFHFSPGEDDSPSSPLGGRRERKLSSPRREEGEFLSFLLLGEGKKPFYSPPGESLKKSLSLPWGEH